MADNYNLESPFLFTKIDIADGFCRLVISNFQTWNFCYVLPTTDGRKVSLGKAELVAQQHYKWDGANHHHFSKQDQKLQVTSSPI